MICCILFFGTCFRIKRGHCFYLLRALALVLYFAGSRCYYSDLGVLEKQKPEYPPKDGRIFLSAAFGLYIADFFLMPFAYGSIDIEKLPFHICTAMCVACFVSRYTPRLGKYRLHFTLLGFLSNLVYLIYPAGVMWHQAHPLSYRAIQTLLFHGTMTIYGFLTLVFDEAGLQWGQFRRDLTVIAGMTLWAVFGNALYTENLPGYNWFFLLQDPFYILPSHIAPFVMPILNIVLFFAAELLLYVVFGVLRKKLHPIPNSEGREIHG